MTNAPEELCLGDYYKCNALLIVVTRPGLIMPMPQYSTTCGPHRHQAPYLHGSCDLRWRYSGRDGGDRTTRKPAKLHLTHHDVIDFQGNGSTIVAELAYKTLTAVIVNLQSPDLTKLKTKFPTIEPGIYYYV